MALTQKRRAESGGGGLALAFVIVLLLVLVGGFSVIGALVDVLVVLLLVGAIVWLVSIIGRGGRWGW